MRIQKFFRPFLYLLGLYVMLCTVLRVLLLFNPITHAHFSLLSLFKIFLMGATGNIFIFVLVAAFLWLYLLFLSDGKYRRPYGEIIVGLFVILLAYLIFSNNILKQYGSVVPAIAVTFVSVKAILFALMLWLPGYRKQIRLVLYSFTVFLFVSLMLLNALSEYFFWNEFGVRYNFIAVDYLIYTNEVIGNIMESYPVVPLFSGLGIIAVGITWFIVRKTRTYLGALPSFTEKIKIISVNVVLIVAGLLITPLLANTQNNPDIFVNELQADGLYKFYRAFLDNKLNYFKFYTTLNNADAFRLLKQQLPGISGESSLHTVKDSLPEIHKNVVLITVESLSESFLAHYGNKDTLTPFLDSLADQSLFFTNLYAAGNRTVRGLEAVTLSLPPGAGESIIKQKDNKNKFTLGGIFKERGYQVKFMYGGYSYFDNMKDFFEGNGYDIVDRSNFKPDEITFANIWGVCDEDMARMAISVMNKEADKGKPFFNHWMTVSNHRPYTYPNGKINIPGDAHSRDGGVKYTDYALRRFFEMAKRQPWYKNTVFVIVADHCASSAGRTALPMDKYRVPAIVYSPGFIRPQQVTTLMSQIDLMPTVLGLLHFSYDSRFYGQNIFLKGYQPRAFIATYQDLGFIRSDTLTVLSPVKKIQQFQLQPDLMPDVQSAFQYRFKENPVDKLNSTLTNEAISFYQTSAWLVQHGVYQRLK